MLKKYSEMLGYMRSWSVGKALVLAGQGWGAAVGQTRKTHPVGRGSRVSLSILQELQFDVTSQEKNGLRIRIPDSQRGESHGLKLTIALHASLC